MITCGERRSGKGGETQSDTEVESGWDIQVQSLAGC